MLEPLVSIIIPVYNVEKYLRQCIESVINQTYKKIEIILINDGSTDTSLNICREYEKNDKRIRVINQDNHGQGYARNIGNKMALGEYIAYVDSDDYVEVTYVEVMLKKALKYESDFVQSCTRKFEDGGKKSVVDLCVSEIEILTASEAMKEFCYQRKINPGPCGKLIRKNILEEIIFPEKLGYEDLGFTYKVIGNSSVIVVIPDVLYHYRQHELSTMHMSFSKKKIDRIIIAKEIVDYVEEFYPENQKASKSRWLLANMQLLMELPFTREYVALKKEVKKNIEIVRWEVAKDTQAKTIVRLMAIMSLFGVNFIMVLGRIYKRITNL